ncbi:hypothetical protein DL95DRAFT_110081 [Leptodontidium sp. 2 PMI_412]|nr:hypothetical protein DL95DRAFT_110081 [Leptodontidium sp. 2 PMI_412]
MFESSRISDWRESYPPQQKISAGVIEPSLRHHPGISRFRPQSPSQHSTPDTNSEPSSTNKPEDLTQKSIALEESQDLVATIQSPQIHENRQLESLMDGTSNLYLNHNLSSRNTI